MIRERKQIAISELAGRVRRVLAIKSDVAQVDLEKVVKNLGGYIEYIDTIFDAYVVKETNEKFKIVVDKKASDERQRFSIAHELGHLFLHMRYLIDDDYWREIPIGTKYARGENQLYSEVEEEANEFAGIFLMPEDIFKQVVDENSDQGYCDTEAVAERFGVSYSCVDYRGYKLGLWRSMYY